MALQIRRGSDSERLGTVFAVGELIYTTDSKKLYVGDGSTIGGLPVTGDPATQFDLINDLTPQLGGNLDLNGFDITGIGDIDIDGNISLTGYITMGDSSGDNINILGSITSNIVPSTTGLTIGTPTRQWDNVYSDKGQFSGQITSNLFLGNMEGTIKGSIIDGDDSVLLNHVAHTLENMSSIETDECIISVSNIPVGTIAGVNTDVQITANNELIVQAGQATINSTAEFDVNADSSSVIITNGYSVTSGTATFIANTTAFGNETVPAEVSIISDAFSNSLKIEISDDGSTDDQLLLFVKNRGTYTSKAQVENGDLIGGFVFNGRTSEVNTNGYTSARIRVVADGTVSGVYVPGKIYFDLASEIDGVQEKMSIDKTGKVSATSFESSGVLYEGATITGFGGDLVLNDFNSLQLDGNITSSGAGIFSSFLFSAFVSATDGANLGRINFSENTFTTTDSNENLVLNASGTGKIEIIPPAIISRIEINENVISSTTSNEDIKLSPSGTGTVDIEIAEQSTVGSAGAAAALPATPSTYFKIKVNGVEYVVPAYAVS